MSRPYCTFFGHLNDSASVCQIDNMTLETAFVFNIRYAEICIKLCMVKYLKKHSLDISDNSIIKKYDALTGRLYLIWLKNRILTQDFTDLNIHVPTQCLLKSLGCHQV